MTPQEILEFLARIAGEGKIMNIRISVTVPEGTEMPEDFRLFSNGAGETEYEAEAEASDRWTR